MGIAGNGRRRSGGNVLGCMAALALGVFGLSPVQRLWLGSPQLVSIQEIPEMGDSCFRPSQDFSVASRREPGLLAAFQTTPVYAQDNRGTEDVTRPPARNIRDTAPTFSSVGVDAMRNEVYLQDSNRWSIRVFSRLDNAKSGEPPTEPRRVISGPTSDVQFNRCVWVDPGSGDIYTVENDTGDSIVVFANRAAGDPEPLRKLKVTHRAQSMAIDDATGELFLSVQYPPQVAIYSKTASGDDKPLRLIQGPKTRFSDVHGIAIDSKNKLLYVTSWGNVSDYRVAGSGRFEPPSISVYPTTANGDTAPLRTIQGPKTRLSYPAGVFVDAKNKEVWASNLGNSTATVYPLIADGDVAPLRVIRSAEEGKASLRFGKTQALVYDPMREAILVPN